MVGETLSFLDLFTVFLDTLYFQVFLFAFLELDASLIYGHYFFPTASKDVWYVFKSLPFHLLLLSPFFIQPMIPSFDSFLRPHQKFLKRLRNIHIIIILIHLTLLIPPLTVLMLQHTINLFLMFLDLLFFDLSDHGIIDRLVLLIEHLVDKLLGFFFDRKMMGIIICEQLLLVLLELKDIHAFYLYNYSLGLVIFQMSEKKEKSKSKSKGKEKVDKADKAEKPPKDVKSKKSKDDKGDSKSKKSVDKTEKVSKKKKEEKSQKPQPANPDLDLSQDNFSDFLKNPFSFPPTITTDDALCPHHKEPNTLFCEICEQTGCESCIVYGPHNNQMHRITRIDEAFQARYLYLNEIVCGPLLEKRDKLNKYLEELTLLSDELRYYKNGIEKLTKVEFNEMLERLKTSAGSKFAVLHHEMADLQRDLEGINTLGNEFFELTNLNPILPNNSEPAPKAIVPFLLRSRYLQEEAENLIAKPIKTSVEIYPYDLPRELTERKLILQRNRNWIELLKLKDEAIWTLNQQKKGLRGKIMDSLNEQAQAQITQWGRLKDQIKNELQQLTLYCEKCRCESNEQTVNEECPKGGYHNFRH